MYSSPRVVTTSPLAVIAPTRSSRARSLAVDLSLLVALAAYLLACHTGNLVRRGLASVVSWMRNYLREQRRTRRTLITAGSLGLAAVLGVSFGAGSSLALWNASTPIGAVSLSTGATGITINGVANYTVPGLTTTQLLPGLSAVSPQVLTILNTGTTPLKIVVGSAVFANPSGLLAQNGNLAVSLFQSTNCAQSVDGSSTAAWTTPVVLAAGASVTACLQMTLSATAPSTVQGLSATFTLPITGTQVRNNP